MLTFGTQPLGCEEATWKCGWKPHLHVDVPPTAHTDPG